MRKYLGPVLAALLAACATTPEVGWQARHAANELAREAVRFAEQPLPNAWTPVETTTAPVALNAPIYEDGGAALVYAGGVEIRSDFNRFHGLSDIDFAADGRTFWSIVDEGLLVRGRVVLDAQGRLTGVEHIRRWLRCPSRGRSCRWPLPPPAGPPRPEGPGSDPVRRSAERHGRTPQPGRPHPGRRCRR